MAPRSSIIRKTLVTGALVAGAGAGAAGVAAAATSSTVSTTSGSSASTAPSGGPSGTPPPGAPANPAAVTHGPDETLLTGTALQKAETAASAAVPGATVVRAETDSSGASPYEVHLKKADGTYVTVELNSNYAAIKTISGLGPGPAGSQPPNSMAPPPQAA
jgi:hypothetical protein